MDGNELVHIPYLLNFNFTLGNNLKIRKLIQLNPFKS